MDFSCKKCTSIFIRINCFNKDTENTEWQPTIKEELKTFYSEILKPDQEKQWKWQKNWVCFPLFERVLQVSESVLLQVGWYLVVDDGDYNDGDDELNNRWKYCVTARNE